MLEWYYDTLQYLYLGEAGLETTPGTPFPTPLAGLLPAGAPFQLPGYDGQEAGAQAVLFLVKISIFSPSPPPYVYVCMCPQTTHLRLEIPSSPFVSHKSTQSLLHMK